MSCVAPALKRRILAQSASLKEKRLLINDINPKSVFH